MYSGSKKSFIWVNQEFNIEKASIPFRYTRTCNFNRKTNAMYIENNRLVPWIEKVYLARRRNLLGEPNSIIFSPPPPLKKSTPPLWSNPGTATVILYKHILFSSVKISFVKELYSYNFCINVSGILSRNQGM